jgi:hypothetical protein
VFEAAEELLEGASAEELEFSEMFLYMSCTT